MGKDKITRDRARMPAGTTALINRRSLKNSHQRLLAFLESGHDVLDVGCGTGAITSGIAQMVHPGKVIGIDENQKFIEEARQAYYQMDNVSFEPMDIYKIKYYNQFDVVTSARVLQWLSDPEKALKKMIAATKIGGYVVVLDYNHEKIKWNPDPPKSMQSFYRAFLQWRLDAGMNNCIADHLAELFSKCGLVNIEVSIQHEATTNSDSDFRKRLDIWAGVVETRGHQMVKDGYINEHDRDLAVKEYREWMMTTAESMQMYLLAVSGKLKGK